MTPRSDAAPKRTPAVKPRRVLEDVAVPVQLVAPYPVTVTQRTCLEWFGISKADYLRLVGRGAFPVRAEGQLRIARFVDVEAYLTDGTKRRRAPTVEAHEPAPAVDPVAAFDVDGFLYKAGFRKITDPEELEKRRRTCARLGITMKEDTPAPRVEPTPHRRPPSAIQRETTARRAKRSNARNR